MKTITVKWVKESGLGYDKAMMIIESDHQRFTKGSRFDFGFMRIAMDEGYSIISIPMLSNQSPITDVVIERIRQDEKWGGPVHDDLHPTYEFVQLIEDYAGWARVMAQMGSNDKARNRLIQVAALAIAAVESIDRKTKNRTEKLWQKKHSA